MMSIATTATCASAHQVRVPCLSRIHVSLPPTTLPYSTTATPATTPPCSLASCTDACLRPSSFTSPCPGLGLCLCFGLCSCFCLCVSPSPCLCLCRCLCLCLCLCRCLCPSVSVSFVAPHLRDVVLAAVTQHASAIIFADESVKLSTDFMRSAGLGQ